MLDQFTKRKLDSARQIFVGKVPDPKAQVEQITTALIYKFMDDMDKENEEVGLKTQFFVKEWNKYSWTKLLDNKLSGQERLDLYVQAIQKKLVAEAEKEQEIINANKGLIEIMERKIKDVLREI